MYKLGGMDGVEVILKHVKKCRNDIYIILASSRIDHLGYVGEFSSWLLVPIEDIKKYEEGHPDLLWLGGKDLATAEQIVSESFLDAMKCERDFSLSTEEEKQLVDEMISLLRKFDYNPTEKGTKEIIKEWSYNKKNIVQLMSKHPNYNGKYQIVFDCNYQREANVEEIRSFYSYLADWMKKNPAKFLTKIKIGKFRMGECEKIISNLKDRQSLYEECHKAMIPVSKYVLDDIESDLKRITNHYNKYLDLGYNFGYQKIAGDLYTAKDFEKYCGYTEAAEALRMYSLKYVNDELARVFKSSVSGLDVKVGQKTSRLVHKFCSLIKITEDPDYEKRYAKYSDAINPLSVTRHTVISCHPIDYLTMSFGNSWSSCHTIDRNNKRELSKSYDGCYSAGTLSYMLDSTSFLYYTVDESYDDNFLELESKISRNMFHLGENKLVQGRVYPQSSDIHKEVYKNIREIVQKVVADCLNISNLWSNSKGTLECDSVIQSVGPHYLDYSTYMLCNVSYLKNLHNIKSPKMIYVGHDPICPTCGKMHDREGCIECYKCEGEHSCTNCGKTLRWDEICYINGYPYCNDCRFYCEYHKQIEGGDCYNIENYGQVCRKIYYSHSARRCSSCGEYFLVNNDDLDVRDGFCSDTCRIRTKSSVQTGLIEST